MEEKFKGKYRIGSTRLKDWDYSSDGWYFVTICTNPAASCGAGDREEFFVKIENGKMVLNEIGKIVAEEWQKTEIIRKNITLDEWIIMPNHIHGIVVIENNDVVVETPRRGVSTSIRNPHHNPQWKPNSLGSIINQFKSICTKKIRKIDPNFSWQPRFYDHIIRDEKSLNRIREYIIYNPLKWEWDRNNTENLVPI